jgi:addiction module HigA family antidote
MTTLSAEPGLPLPGFLLRNYVLPGLNLSVKQAAADLRITRQTLHRVLAGSASVTPEMAVRLERLTGVPAETWLALQEKHDLRRAKVLLMKDIKHIPSRSLPSGVAAIVEHHARTQTKLGDIQGTAR